VTRSRRGFHLLSPRGTPLGIGVKDSAAPAQVLEELLDESGSFCCVCVSRICAENNRGLRA
jgi:hypothetical protein